MMAIDRVDETGGGARFVLALLCVLLAVVLGAAVLAVPMEGAGLRDAVLANLKGAGADNPVTAVLLSFRGYDTLLETGVLLLALLGAWSLTPDGFWGGVPGRSLSGRAPEAALSYFSRSVVPVSVLVGAYLLWAGAHAPGGAFQAGTVIAAAGVLVMLSGAADPPATCALWLRLVLILGFVVFLGAGLYGMVGADAFLAWPPEAAKAFVLTIEIMLTVSIAATLALLCAGVPERAP